MVTLETDIMGFLLFYRAFDEGAMNMARQFSNPAIRPHQNRKHRQTKLRTRLVCQVRSLISTYRPRFPRVGREPEVPPRGWEELRPGCALFPRLPWPFPAASEAGAAVLCRCAGRSLRASTPGTRLESEQRVDAGGIGCRKSIE